MAGRKDQVYRFTRAAAGIFFSPVFRVRIEGREQFPPAGPFVLLPKHQRWEDIPLLALATPRPLYYIAKYELFENRLAGGYLRSVGGIPLNRQRPLESRRSIKTVIDLLGKGEGIVLFPEGTYYRDRMGPGHAGMLRLILSRMAPPLIPVGIRYRRDRWRTSVHVRFGRPFHVRAGMSAGRLMDHVMERIARLSGLSPTGD